MSWNELLDTYLASLAEQGRRPHTIRGYRGDLRGLVKHVGERPVDASALQDWLSSLDGLALATRARRISAARGFLRWAATRGGAVDGLEVLEVMRSERRAGTSGPRPLAWTTVEATLASIPRQADRDQLLFKLLALAGLRPGEAIGLRIEDFDHATAHLRVSGWGGADREVLIDDPELRLRLTHWIRATGRTSGPLFCAPGRSSPLRYQSVLERWQRYASASGTRLRLGDLRLGYAALLLAGGVPEWVIRQRLGQPTGPLPIPAQTVAEEEIRAWRSRLPSPRSSRQPHDENHARRTAG